MNRANDNIRLVESELDWTYEEGQKNNALQSAGHRGGDDLVDSKQKERRAQSWTTVRALAANRSG